jgi:hypothetical protein
MTRLPLTLAAGFRAAALIQVDRGIAGVRTTAGASCA